jgi:hypothetical protein
VKRGVVLLIAIAWIAGSVALVRAQSSVQARFEAAMSAYREGRFAVARDEFRALLRERAGAAVPLLDAIGRCSSELSEHAQAIAAYRSALLRAGGDAAIVAALRQAERELGMDPSSLTRRERGLAIWIAVSGAGVQLLGVVLWMRGRRALGGLLWAVGIGGSAVAAHDVLASADGRAVVVAPEVALAAEPGAAIDAASPRLRAGEVVDVRAAADGLLLIDHERGAGWVPSGSLAPIE